MRMWGIIKLLLLLLYYYLIFLAAANLQIFNGSPTEPGQYPYYVLIQGCTDYYCGSIVTGGVLLSSNWVLTDYYSIKNSPFPQHKAILGLGDLRNQVGVQNFSVYEIVMYPEYTEYNS